MKWLAIAGVVLLVGLLLLWREVRSEESPAAVAPAAVVERPVRPPRPVAEDRSDEGLPPPERPYRPAGTLAPGDQEGPIKKYSEEFWERVDEVYARRLMQVAAPCYDGGKHRKAKLKVAFQFDITGGAVAVKNARIVESTLDDPKLEQCMLREVAKAQWKDPRMPDWASSTDEEETLVIRIDGLKRFGPETD